MKNQNKRLDYKAKNTSLPSMHFAINGRGWEIMKS